MSGDQVKAFCQRWQAILGALIMSGGAVVAVMTWGDSRYVPRAELGQDQIEMLAALDPDRLVGKEDMKPIQENLKFLTTEFIKERVTALDSRIQILEALPDLSRDERQTLNELRYERSQLETRLRKL